MQGVTEVADKTSLRALAGRSSSMPIDAGLVCLGLLFVIIGGLDAIH